MGRECPVCETLIDVERRPMPGELARCRRCRSALYFGPIGWRVLEDHELEELSARERTALERP